MIDQLSGCLYSNPFSPNKELESVYKSTILLTLMILMFMTPVVDATEQTSVLAPQALATHEIVIDAHSWKSFPIQCHEGDTLSGNFIIEKNTELFPGDQTEYDNWLLDGIDFFVFDEENYISWAEGSLATPILEKPDLEQLTWSIEIPHNDVWYVVYSNDSIFMKEIEGNIVHSGSDDLFLLSIALVGLAGLLSLLLVLWKKK